MIDSAPGNSWLRPQAASYAATPQSTWFHGRGDDPTLYLRVMRSWVPLHYTFQIDHISLNIGAMWEQK